MPDTAYKDRYDDLPRPQGAFELIHSVDKNVRDIIADMPPELAARWRKVKLNNTFAQFQD